MLTRLRRFRPSLLATFSVVSFVLIAALGVALAVGIQGKLEESALQQQAQNAADEVSKYLTPALLSSDLQEPWPPTSHRFFQLDNLIRNTILRDHVVRVKIWRPDGTILYSDKIELIGQKFDPEGDLADAMAGEVHMDVSDLKDTENEFEKGQFDRLLEIYMPLRSAGSTRPEAVFEVYHDLAAVDALNGETRTFTWSALAIGFVILYASLFTLVYRASRTLTRRNNENARLYKEVSQRLVERMRAEQILRDRVEFERLIMAISTNFLNLGPQEVDNGVRQSLRALGTHTGVDRCYVLRFDHADDTTAVTHEWCARGVVPLMGVMKKMSARALPWIYERLSQGEAANIERVANLPSSARAELDFLQALSSKSALLVPMVYNKKLVGALGLDHVQHEGSWSEDGVGLLKIAGEILINAMERRRAEEAIRESEQRFRAVFESAAFAIAISDNRGYIIESNKPFQEILGYTGEELKSLRFADVTHPEDANQNTGYFRELMEGKRAQYSMEKRYIRKNGDVVWTNLLVSALRDAKGAPQYSIAMVQDVTERRRAQEEIKRQIERLNSLRTIDNAITSSFDLTNTLEVVLGQVTSQLSVDAASVLVLNPRTGTLDYVAGRGFHSDMIARSRTGLGQGLAGRAAVERRLVQVPDLTTTTDFLRAPLIDGDSFLAYFAVPLMAKGKVVGVLEVFNRTPLEPQGEWLHFLETLSGQTAIAVDNSLLFQDLQRYNLELSLAYDTTLEGWSHALDLRDKETEGHTQRVTEMTVRLAVEMGIDDTALVHIRRGALLHDIGKMGIPDSILLKPGPLSDDEWEIMRLHPSYAHQLLAPIPFLHPSLDIPYCHHEKWDGTGYPRGLKGEGIPLAARIFAIVDVYDALRSNRPYRSAWPEEKVLQHIVALSGSHFDPDVVDAFLRMDRSFYRHTPTTPHLVADLSGMKF